MRVFTRRTLREFWERHPDSEEALDDWYRVAERADWSTPAEVRLRYGNASVIANNRVVFNIKGNNYRLVVRIDYAYRMIFVRFIGSHAEYDRINAAEV